MTLDGEVDAELISAPLRSEKGRPELRAADLGTQALDQLQGLGVQPPGGGEIAQGALRFRQSVEDRYLPLGVADLAVDGEGALESFPSHPRLACQQIDAATLLPGARQAAAILGLCEQGQGRVEVLARFRQAPEVQQSRAQTDTNARFQGLPAVGLTQPRQSVLEVRQGGLRTLQKARAVGQHFQWPTCSHGLRSLE